MNWECPPHGFAGAHGRTCRAGAARRFLDALLLLAALILTPPVRATRQVPLAPEQLASAAECIVTGVVRSIEVHRDAAGRILTRMVVTVDERWKPATTGAQVEIELGGGTLGERRVAATDFAWPGVGDAAVWFLLRNPAGHWSVVALDQGCYRIDPLPGGSRVVWNSQSARVGPGLPGPVKERLRLTLDELRRRVLSAVKEEA